MTNSIIQDKQNLSYDPKLWKQGYQSQPNEYDYFIEDIEGKIPR